MLRITCKDLANKYSQNKWNVQQSKTLDTDAMPTFRLRSIRKKTVQCLALSTSRLFSTSIATDSPSVKLSGDNLQQFDFAALKACVWDVQERLIPSRVDNVVQYQEQSIALGLRTVVENHWLAVSWDPLSAHVGLKLEGFRRGSTSEVFSFGSQLKKSLRGLILVDVEIPCDWERVAKFSFSERPGQPPKFSLYIELMGKHSNLILCDSEEHIMAAGNQVGSKKSSQRLVQVARNYVLPPLLGGIPPDDVSSAEEFRDCLLKQITSSGCVYFDTALYGCFRGVGPSTAREIRMKTGYTEPIVLKNMEPSEWHTLYQAWIDWIDKVKNNKFSCNILDDQLLSCTSGAESMMRPLAFYGSYYDSHQTSGEILSLKQSLARAIKKQLQKLNKKLVSLERQILSAEEHMNTKMKADMIMAHMHSVKDGGNVLKVVNWETGQEEEINLDPSKTMIENAEALYKTARKQRRGAQKVIPLMEECRDLMDYLSECELMVERINIEESDVLDVLSQIEAELLNLGIISRTGKHKLKEQSAKKSKRKQQGAPSNYRSLTSPNGFEVLVGRSSQQNDTITMRIAKTGDIWMHARGYPGAHVLIRVSNSKQPGEEDIQFAANLAAFYSKASSMPRVQVIMADKKDITKPKGANPGQVLVKKEEVVVGYPDKCDVK